MGRRGRRARYNTGEEAIGLRGQKRKQKVFYPQSPPLRPVKGGVLLDPTSDDGHDESWNVYRTGGGGAGRSFQS